LTHLFYHCLQLPNFPKSWKNVTITTLPKPSKGPKFPQNYVR
jgi:hypothetical protein